MLKKYSGLAVLLPAMMAAAYGSVNLAAGQFGGGSTAGCAASWFLIGLGTGMALTGVLAPAGVVGGLIGTWGATQTCS